MKEFLIIIPAYNEEKTIGKVLEELNALPSVKSRGDILVVDDASVDKTPIIAKSCKATVLTQVYNMGYGSCLQTGYKYASRKGYKYIVQMDADGQHDVKDVERIYSILKDSKEPPVDIVIGSRFLTNDYSSVSFLKKVAGKLFGKIIKLGTGVRITDPTSGLQGLNRRTFSYYAGYTNFDDKYPDANILMDMILQGHKIVEIPVVMFSRSEGESMHSGLKPLGYMFRMVLSLAAVWIDKRSVTRRQSHINN